MPASNNKVSRNGRLVSASSDPEGSTRQLQNALALERQLRIAITAQLECLKQENESLENKNMILQNRLLMASKKKGPARSDAAPVRHKSMHLCGWLAVSVCTQCRC